MRSERTLRRMRTFCQTQLNRMNQPSPDDPLSVLGLSEMVRERMQLRIDLLDWVLEEAPWPERDRQRAWRKMMRGASQ